MFVVDYATILRNGRGFFERVYIIKEKKASAEQSDIDASIRRRRRSDKPTRHHLKT